MKLNIPQQTTATATSSPSNPRKLKKVLSVLPNTNMGELTKQTFYILRDQNRQIIPNKDRLENLEMLRVLARDIFKNLNKYFINRTLPLPDKSKKIINLNQSILQELIYGYQIIANEAKTEAGSNVHDKTLTVAICRAISYLSEMLLRCSEIYEHCPENLWQNTHQLYMLAEDKNLIDKIVIDTERKIEETTIASSYKQILLFSLARPTALRQSDCDRIYKELFNWSEYASIKEKSSDDMVDCCFCMQITKDLAPSYLHQKHASEDSNVRILDTKKLVSHVADLVETQSKDKQKIVIGENIPLETLTTLLSSWGENPKRKFSRADRHEHINVAIGLAKICKAMNNQQESKAPPVASNQYGLARKLGLKNSIAVDSRHDFFQSPESSKDEPNVAPPAEDPNYTLEYIDKSGQQEFKKRSALDYAEDESAWDMVAKGRALTGAYEEEKQHINKQRGHLPKHSTDSHWQVVNISAGGYCLRWNSDDTSKAQIGELIALQEYGTNHLIKWHIGVIRWMQFTREDGLEIGVQILSPQVTAATAQRANRLDEAPFDCLLLPGIKSLNQSSSTLLPSHAFTTNAKLIARIFEHRLNITLGEALEHTGSFTQFSYSNTDLDSAAKNPSKKDDTTENMDDFDELWSSL